MKRRSYLLTLLIGLGGFSSGAHAQAYICGNGAGPGETQVGFTQGGQGIAAMPLCMRNVPAQPAAPIPDDYVAFASDDQVSNLFWSTYYHSQQSADEAAIAACSKATGRACRSLGGVSNQCGAIAISSDNATFNGASTNPKLAAKRALEACNAANADNLATCRLGSLPVCAGRAYFGKSTGAATASNEDVERFGAATEARKYWGAMSMADDQSLHGSYGYRNQAAAEREALKQCTNCKVVKTFESTCVGVAWLEGNAVLALVLNDDPQAAMDKAKAQCSNSLGASCSAVARCSGRRYPKSNPFAADAKP